MGLKSAVKDFRSGLSIIFNKPKVGEGDRKLAKMSLIVEGQIGVYGKRTVQSQVIKSIEGDMKRTARKGKDAVEALIQNGLDTPEYMSMLHKIGLEEPHIRVMAMEALKKYAK